MRLLLSLLLAAALGAAPSAAQDFRAELSGPHATPPTDSPATGTAECRLDGTKMLHVSLTMRGLVGEELESHVHGPRPDGHGGIAFPLPLGNVKEAVVGPFSPAMEESLLAGRWWITIHTTEVPAGEIEGWIVPLSVPAEPISVGLWKGTWARKP